MLAELDVINLISGKATIPQKVKEKLDLWRGVYYRMSLHIDGACPAFRSLRYVESTRAYTLGKRTFPNNYLGIPYQELFDIYHFSAHPKEPEITRQWRYSQYKPFTQAPFLEAIDIITGAVFQDSGYVVKVDDVEDNEYVNGNNFHGKPLVEYLSSNFGSVSSDPNGYFVIIPNKSRDEYEDGEAITVEICYIFSKWIRWVSKDEIIFDYDGFTWNVNKIGYFRYKQEDKGWVNVDGENDGYYAHMLEELPIIVGGGKWNAQGYYDSWLMAARPHADEFITGKSAEQMVNKEASYPIITESEVECPTCHGSMAVEVDCDCSDNPCPVCLGTQRINEPCGRCNGKGYMSRNPADRLVVPASMMDNDLVRIVNPDVAINKFHAENNKELYRVIMESLHLYKLDQAQSGEAKKMDMQGRYQFFNSICKDWFYRIIDRAIWIILSLRDVTVVSEGEIAPNINPEYTVIAPNDYQIKSGYDLAEEYKMADESGLPDYVKVAMNRAFIEKQFGGDELMKCKALYIQMMDSVSVATAEDIQLWLLNGAITQRDAQRHVLLPNILDNIVREMGADDFINAPYETILAKANAMLPPEPMAVRPTSLIERVDT